MASALGALFVRSSLAPLHAASDKLLKGQLADGLEALRRERLQGGVDAGVAAVAKQLGMHPERIQALLPSAELKEALNEADRCQAAACAAIGQFVTSLDSFLPGVNPSGVPVSERLHAVAAKYTLDEHIREPVASLAEAIVRWEAAINQSGQKLSSNASLRAHAFRQTLTKVAILLVVLTIVAVISANAFWQRVVVATARERIASVLVQPDPCLGESIAVNDLDHVLPEQNVQLEKMKQLCAQQRARQARLERCAALADHLEAGTLDAQDATMAASTHALLQRVVSRTLTPKDLSIESDAMPCQDTPSRASFWAVYTKAATDSVELWGRVDVISNHVGKLLTAKGVELSPRAKATLVFRVEIVTKRAITKGIDSELQKARRLCALVEKLGYPREPWCRALGRIKETSHYD